MTRTRKKSPQISSITLAYGSICCHDALNGGKDQRLTTRELEYSDPGHSWSSVALLREIKTRIKSVTSIRATGSRLVSSDTTGAPST